jgi:hypothetical protein
MAIRASALLKRAGSDRFQFRVTFVTIVVVIREHHKGGIHIKRSDFKSDLFYPVL